MSISADVDGNSIVDSNNNDIILNYVSMAIKSFPCSSYIISDVDLDRNVGMADVNKMLWYIMNNDSLSITKYRATNINNDGAVNIDGLSALIDYLS